MSDNTNANGHAANTTSTVTDKDLRCAEFARAALFPKRMHRNVAHANHFPALVQLDLLRDYYLPQSTVSAIFPRHVVVVPNVLAVDDGSPKTIQWNGAPDIDTSTASFDVIPGKISVRCTSDCSKLLNHATQRAFVETHPTPLHYHHHNHFHNHNNPNNDVDDKEEEEIQIVLCTDRILQKDHLDQNYTGVAKELPPKTMQAVEEVLAHELAVKVQQKTRRVTQPSSDDDHNDDHMITAATIQLMASQVAECYFSRHAAYNDNTNTGGGGGRRGETSDKKQHPPQQIKQGSRLPMGYSWLPTTGGWKDWAMQRCRTAVATEQLQYSSSVLTFPPAISAAAAAGETESPTVLSKAEAQAAVQKALQQQKQQQEQEQNR
jgi:hypothetical protein